MRPVAAVVLALALAGPFLLSRDAGPDDDPAGARYLPPLTRAHIVPLRAGGIRVVTSLARVNEGWAGRRAGAEVFLPDAELAGRPVARYYPLGTDGLGRDLLDRMLRGAPADVVGSAKLDAVLQAGARHPDGEPKNVMIAPIRPLRPGRAPKFSREHNQRFVE